MAEEKQPPNILWRDKKTGKIIRKKKNGRLIVCWVCPCCKPKVLASTITNARTGPKEWDLKPYQKEGWKVSRALRMILLSMPEAFAARAAAIEL